MKQYEELTRLHVNEAIQRGLEAQRIHRGLSESEKARSFSVKSVRWVFVGLLLILSLVTGTAALAAGQADIAKIRASTAQFHRTEAAQAAGYDLVPGLDHCFENPGIGGMGYHFINTGILDLTVDELQPEAMVYIPSPNEGLQLGAVEFIVPAEAWDAAGNAEPPTALGQSFHLNPTLGVYVLHAWIWKDNPSGMFEDWNPTVSCP
jgi:hypothetical protein